MKLGCNAPSALTGLGNPLGFMARLTLKTNLDYTLAATQVKEDLSQITFQNEFPRLRLVAQLLV
jgi:hypothetical protein